MGDGIPASNTFSSVIYERLGKSYSDIESWCTVGAWFGHSPQYDFHVKNAYGYIRGLPVLVPTCPKRLFALGPRKKYVDIVTDTLHASSSDLITWNSLVMIKLNWAGSIPGEWGEITTYSLEEWKSRSRLPTSPPEAHLRLADEWTVAARDSFTATEGGIHASEKIAISSRLDG